MARKLPPLHLLHLFEASGRHASFKKAGEELHLTPSAISHQIKALEENLGVALFNRLSRGVNLTPAGKNYLFVVQDIFQRLDQGTTALKQRYSKPPLRLSTFPSISSNIIIPKLSRFQQQFPDIELRLDTGANLVDLRYEEIDLAIRLGPGEWTGVTAEKLFDIEVTPMCSPEFAEKYQLKDIQQINQIPLLNLSSMEGGWTTFAVAVGMNAIDPKAVLSLGTYDAVIQSAQQGLGLALGALPIENSAIKKGLLIRPFKEKIQFPHACFAVYRPQDKQRKDILAFLDWFKQLDELKSIDQNEQVNSIHL